MRKKSYVLLVMTSLIIGGCAQGIKNEKTSSLKTLKIKDPYPKPNTVEMKGGMWLLVKPLSATYYNKADPSETYSIEVPAGFVMDLASIPKPLRILTGKYHDLDTAAIIHDYLFWVQPCKQEGNGKRIADKLYKDTLKASEDVSWLNAWGQWIALKGGSRKAWANNQKLKNDGESRFMPKAYWANVTKETDWSDLKGECCSKHSPMDFNFPDNAICTIKPESAKKESQATGFAGGH